MIASHLMLKAARAPDAMLRLIALANTLFFASFVLAILFAASTQAKAQDIACTGMDMTKTMSATAMAEAKAEAAKTLNGDHRLWKVEKDGLRPSYLFGTMHMTDPRVTELTPEARAAFDSSSAIVIETTDVLDEMKAAKALLTRPDLMMFTDNTTLTSLVPPEKLDEFKAGLDKRGLPLVTINKMKPWMLLGILAVPACELKRKQSGVSILDVKIAEDAKIAGKDVGGLETMFEQLDAMAKVPMDFHIKGMIETVALGDQVDDVMETMLTLYTQGEIALIMPVLKQIQPEGAEAQE
ncbi:MAG: TraB/GumN family protein, partial [Rhizobiaceae bacterium]